MDKVKYFSFIPLVIGVGLLIGGYFYTKNVIEFKKIAQETNAVITAIEEYESGEDTEHDVYVRYNVNGKEYEGELGYYDSLMRLNKTIKILYDPWQPEKIKPASSFGLYFASVIFFVFGIILLACGALMYTGKIKRR